MRQEIIDLYDAYTHEGLDRRAFMNRLAALAGGVAAASALLPLLESNYARAAIVPEDDDRLATERITFPGASGEVLAYLARPADAEDVLPGIVVIHENRGLNPHIEDVARRAALEGFVAMAPDLLSSAGGTPPDPDAAREMIRDLDGDLAVREAIAANEFMRVQSDGSGKVGAVGFCWGGGIANQVALNDPKVSAVVAFYGRQPENDDGFVFIRAPLLLHYAGLDERINAGIEPFRKGLQSAGVEYTIHMYEGVNHAFHNDTGAARYDKEAAELAWSRTIEFFKTHLAS